MPVKRRIDKARHLDEYRLTMLRYGPDSMLLAGSGYLSLGPVGHFRRATPEQQAVMLAAMRADWERHRERLLADGGDWWASQFDAT